MTCFIEKTQPSHIKQGPRLSGILTSHTVTAIPEGASAETTAVEKWKRSDALPW